MREVVKGTLGYVNVMMVSLDMPVSVLSVLTIVMGTGSVLPSRTFPMIMFFELETRMRLLFLTEPKIVDTGNTTVFGIQESQLYVNVMQIISAQIALLKCVTEEMILTVLIKIIVP